MSDLVERLHFSSCATCRDALAEIERLRAENAELRADAERYRWLRDASVINGSLTEDSELWSELGDLIGADFDDAIDAARASVKGST